MKLSIENNKKEFTPFNLSMTIESIEEARLLFHVLSYDRMRPLIQNDPIYDPDRRFNWDKTLKCFDPEGEENNIGIIQDEIEKQGFSI